jgi:hypothetical protein
MKLTEEEMESAKCALIDETSDYILSRVCDVMHEKLIEPLEDDFDQSWMLDEDQIDEVVCSVFKGLYYEKEKTEQ